MLTKRSLIECLLDNKQEKNTTNFIIITLFVRQLEIDNSLDIS